MLKSISKIMRAREAKRLARLTSREWFDKRCVRGEPIWEAHIERALNRPLKEGDVRLERPQITARLRENARTTREQRDKEIASMVTRGAAVLSAAAVIFTVLFAVAAISGSADISLAERIILALAFTLTIIPFAPAVRKAWGEPYMAAAHWTGLDQDDFTGWVLDNYLADRRSPVAQKYKRLHSVAVWMYVAAWVASIFN